MDSESEKTQTKVAVKSPLKKHLSSTFPSMIGRYMSDDQLADHVSHQMSFFNKKYESEDEPIAEEKKKSKKKVKFKKNKQSSESNTTTAISDEETEKEIERKEYREGLRDRMLEDLELLRDYYKRIYKRALVEKVTSQHKDFKHRDARAMARGKRLKEKEERQKHKVVITLPKSKVTNDQSYKEGIQETNYHKIIKLEHQLKKEGYLSKVSEIQAFWSFILFPGNLARILKKGKLSWEEVQQHERKYRFVTEAPDEKTTKDQKWSDCDIEKLIKENTRGKYWRRTKHSRPRLFTPSGLTDISSSLSNRKATSAASTSKQKSASRSAPSSALTLDQLFPKVEFPELAAYTLVFGEQEPDPEEIEKELEMERKEEAKRDARIKLLTMFSHALANRAATQRLMQKNQNFRSSNQIGTSSVSELLDRNYERISKPVPLTKAALKAHDSETRISEEKSVSSSSSSPKPSRTVSSMSQTTNKDNRVSVLQKYERLPPIVVPLSLPELEESCPIKEAKGLSTLWVNPFSNKKSQTISS